MSKDHGNSYKNKELHHLYAIMDNKTDDVFKYGITDDPIGKDGLSDRMRKQINWANLIAGWVRFFGKILLTNIPGRKKAREIEDAHIDAYLEKHGHKPIGNPEKLN